MAKKYTEKELLSVLPHPLHPAARAFKGKSVKEIKVFAEKVCDAKGRNNHKRN